MKIEKEKKRLFKRMRTILVEEEMIRSEEPMQLLSRFVSNELLKFVELQSRQLFHIFHFAAQMTVIRTRDSW